MGAGARENRGRCAAVLREAKDERAGGERSKKAGSRRNYAILDISQSKKGGSQECKAVEAEDLDPRSPPPPLAPLPGLWIA